MPLFYPVGHFSNPHIHKETLRMLTHDLQKNMHAGMKEQLLLYSLTCPNGHSLKLLI